MYGKAQSARDADLPGRSGLGGYIVVLAAHILQKEQEKAMAKGRGEGRVEGRDEAYKDADEQNDAYYRRMRAALDAGEPFDEPPPRFRRNGR